MKNRTITITTYKHQWALDLQNGVATIHPRKRYPLGFLRAFSKKFSFLAVDRKIENDPSVIYEDDPDIAVGAQKFTTPIDIEVQENRADVFAALLKRYGIDISGKSVLDISGGSGVFVKRLLHHGAISVSNTEFSMGSVKYGKEVLGIPAYYYDLNSDKLSQVIAADAKYDVVMLRGCIEFCDNLDQLIDELKIITHKESILVLTFIDPTLGVALRTQFDQYNVKICRPAVVVNEAFHKKGYTNLIDSEMFLFERNYAYMHLRGPFSLFYVWYLIFGLIKLRKHNYPRDFHALDAKCALVAYKLKS